MPYSTLAGETPGGAGCKQSRVAQLAWLPQHLSQVSAPTSDLCFVKDRICNISGKSDAPTRRAHRQTALLTRCPNFSSNSPTAPGRSHQHEARSALPPTPPPPNPQLRGQDSRYTMSLDHHPPHRGRLEGFHAWDSHGDACPVLPPRCSAGALGGSGRPPRDPQPEATARGLPRGTATGDWRPGGERHRDDGR